MKRNYESYDATVWYKNLLKDLSQLPFSFVYDGKEYKGFNNDFLPLEKNTEKCGDKEKNILKFSLRNELEITLVLTHYYSHGVTEWTVWFENASKENSGVIENVKTEILFEGDNPKLKGILGDHVNQYMPYNRDLSNNVVEFSTFSGRPTHLYFPYFNIEYGNRGAMLAIGWAGTWSAEFSSDGNLSKYTARSVNGLKTYLKPGEKIRTALFVLAPYSKRDEHYATNFWRDWYIKYNLPKADLQGNDMKPISTCFLAYDTGLPNSDGSISECHTTWRPSLEKMIEENIKVDFRWFDAGWYIAPDGTSAQSFVPGHDWWFTVGTWEFDPQKWPGKTFLESTEFARQNGMKTIVWFEPERITDPENLAKNYGYNPDWAICKEGNRSIANNIGDDDCREWITKRVCKTLKDNKIEMYREDNNFGVGELWDYRDISEGENRKGITESKYIDGHYKMWDDIIECTLSNGGCGFVDSCAAGGGKNDLESMRRGVPLLRSDSDRTTAALRLSMTTSFNKWIPFCGANTVEKTHECNLTGVSDEYVWRASYLPVLNIQSQFVCDENQNFDLMRWGIDEWKRISPFLLKEFYPLTMWHSEKNTYDFTVHCYYDPEQEQGIILAFRQENCVRDSITVSLPFAEESNRYVIKDEDSGEEKIVNKNITLFLGERRSAKLLWINKEENE